MRAARGLWLLKDWVGKRVVQKHKNSPLYNEGRSVPGSGENFSIYRVERVEGRRLWLKDEEAGHTGWADIDAVVPLDRAIAFFTDQLRACPCDGFLLISRAVMWTDQENYDRALEDCDEAISLDPQSYTYACRGKVWI